MKIGITVDCIVEDKIKLNGDKHYVYNLYKMLSKNHEVYYIIDSKIINNRYKYEIDNENFDIIIQYDYMIKNMYKNTKMILLIDKNVYEEDMSEIMYGKREVHNNVYYNLNEIWILEGLEKIESYVSIIYGRKPKYVPLIWEEGIENKFIRNRVEDEISIGVMDDNKSIDSVCLMPICVGDSYVLNNSLRMYVFNGMKLKQNVYFSSIVSKMELYKRKLISFEGEYNMDNIYSKFCNIMMISKFDYMIFEGVVKGIPVLHNCERYKEIGYYYDSIENAKDKIENIVMFHEMNLENYISKSKEILSKLNYNSHQDTYNKLLL